jgi:TRAP-type uncharacterized transport system substrate-binding protein
MKYILPALCFWAASWSAVDAQPVESSFTILVGEPSWIADAQALAKSLDHEGALRVLPVLGQGSIQAMQDITQFPALDSALVTADSLSYVKAQNLLGIDEQKFSYITAIKPLPIILVARKNIANITALAGKRIATGPAYSANFAAGELIMGAMEIPFLRVAQTQDAAIEALAKGKADAALVLGTPKNLALLRNNEFHILPIVMPPELSKIYTSNTLSNRDVPGLLANGQKIESIQTQLLLAVSDPHFDATQRVRLKQFETEIFKQSKTAATITLPGWPRQPDAESLLSTLNLNATIEPTGATP